MPRYVFQHPGWRAVYVDLVATLPPATELVFLVHGSVRAELEALLHAVGKHSRAHFVEAPEEVAFSAWVEDTCVVLQEGGAGRVHLAEPVALKRADDREVTTLVAAQIQAGRSGTGLYFEGGNLLVGDDFWLLGADNALHTAHLRLVRAEPDEPPLAAARRAFARVCDATRRLYLVGCALPVPVQAEQVVDHDGEAWTHVLHAGNVADTVQPIFHLDMFVTLAGRDGDGRAVVLVGDPRLAATILGEPLADAALAPLFDDIAAQLSEHGFGVVRNPLPRVYVDDAEQRRRKWYYASSNNALVEIVGVERRVWLPTYGHGAWAALAATDASNRRTWESLGFTVTMLTDCHPLAANLGGIHCIKKYLARGP